LIHHSDRDGQYCSNNYKKSLTGLQMTAAKFAQSLLVISTNATTMKPV
jgi:hypothetical protein